MSPIALRTAPSPRFIVPSCAARRLPERSAHPSDASGHRSPRRNDDCGGNGPARPSAALYGYERRVPRVERPLPVRRRDRGSERRDGAGSPQRRRRAQGGSSGGAGSGGSGGG